MKLVRFGDSNKEKPGIILVDGRMLDVSSFGEDYDQDFFGTDGIVRLSKWLSGKKVDSAGLHFKLPLVGNSARVGPPVCRPGKIVCIGLNYRDHAKEIGMEIPSEPVLFMKSPSALAGPFDNLVLPRNSIKTDWEVELAVIIGRKTTYIETNKALDCIAGFVLFNDYSERDFQFNRGGQWVKGKSSDTFASLGPFLATPEEIADPGKLRIWLRVNGKLKQDSNTSHMIFDVPEIVAWVSRYMTLLPGDIISTGTPAGVGYRKTPSEYLKRGDIVEYGIEGLGEASQKVVQWDDSRYEVV